MCQYSLPLLNSAGSAVFSGHSFFKLNLSFFALVILMQNIIVIILCIVKEIAQDHNSYRFYFSCEPFILPLTRDKI